MHAKFIPVSSLVAKRRNTSDLFLEDLRAAIADSKKEEQNKAAAATRLEDRLRAYGLTKVPNTDAEGNCQFDCIADQLNRVFPDKSHTHQTVRHTVVKWLKDNADSYVCDLLFQLLTSSVNQHQGQFALFC